MSTTVYNFIRGAGSVLDLLPDRAPTQVGSGLSVHQSTNEVMARDWNRIFEDMQKAYCEVTGEAQEHVEGR